MLIGLHLLGSVGGYWVLYGVQQRNRALLAQKLDQDDYAGSQAITIKLPLSQPVSDKENYERVDGEFEYEGTVYRLIKQKFYKDTVYIVCYKDSQSILIKDALEDYVSSLTDNPKEKKSDNKVASVSIKDYVHQHTSTLDVKRTSQHVVNSTRYLINQQQIITLSVDHPPEKIG